MPLVGPSPVFVDIDPDTYNLDPVFQVAAIEAVKREGKLTPKAVIAVDLFGGPADYPAIAKVAREHGLKLISDSAQGFGCTLDGKHPIHWADVTTTSFFPAKPLGCYGDGGAVLSKDETLHDLLVSLRVHGQAVKSDIEGKTFEHDPKYLNVRIGMNSRMDTIQAAVLIEKLKIFEDEIAARNRVADRYAQGLRAILVKRPPTVLLRAGCCCLGRSTPSSCPIPAELQGPRRGWPRTCASRGCPPPSTIRSRSTSRASIPAIPPPPAACRSPRPKPAR